MNLLVYLQFNRNPTDMIIEKKQIKDLKPAPYNPRKSSEEQEKQLSISLDKFGAVEPIIFNKKSGYIVGGHFRVRELKKLGYKEIECVIVDLNEADEKELNIRLNSNTGAWDFDLLATGFDSDDLKGWGVDVPKFESMHDEYGEDFSLKDGDKEPFQQMTFTLADEQSIEIKNAIADIKKTDEYKYYESDNKNSNGNALYLIVMKWKKMNN